MGYRCTLDLLPAAPPDGQSSAGRRSCCHWRRAARGRVRLSAAPRPSRWPVDGMLAPTDAGRRRTSRTRSPAPT